MSAENWIGLIGGIALTIYLFVALVSLTTNTTRAAIRLLLPLSVIGAIILIANGSIENLHARR